MVFCFPVSELRPGMVCIIVSYDFVFDRKLVLTACHSVT